MNPNFKPYKTEMVTVLERYPWGRGIEKGGARKLYHGVPLQNDETRDVLHVRIGVPGFRLVQNGRRFLHPSVQLRAPEILQKLKENECPPRMLGDMVGWGHP
jgi:hypothetical protein